MALVISHSSFFNSDVRVDSTDFDTCVFDGCLLIYGGGLLPRFMNCKFSNCGWTFEGPALRAVQLIRGLAEGMGPDGKHFIASIFLAPTQPAPAEGAPSPS